MRGRPPAYMGNARDLALAAELRRIRLERGIPQKLIAARVGVTRATISFWETGKNRPSTLTDLGRWARAVGKRLVIELR